VYSSQESQLALALATSSSPDFDRTLAVASFQATAASTFRATVASTFRATVAGTSRAIGRTAGAVAS
jgi:hypothetical protein